MKLTDDNIVHIKSVVDKAQTAIDRGHKEYYYLEGGERLLVTTLKSSWEVETHIVGHPGAEYLLTDDDVLICMTECSCNSSTVQESIDNACKRDTSAMRRVTYIQTAIFPE